MPRNRTLLSAAALLAVATFTTTGRAQDVILSELGNDGSGGWIELHNRGATSADVSTWSLYLTTATPGRVQTYWWGFRAGTAIPAGGFLLVRWLAPVPSPPIAGEVATGSSQFDFLFGLGAEAVPLGRGALALLRSQQNALMNSPTVFADWVSWGSGGLTRESLAQQAGVWLQDHATPALSAGRSIARHPRTLVPNNPEQAWFVDDTPTPGQDNVGAADMHVLGSPCAPIGHHLLGAPMLAAISTPVLGNAAFALRVTNTTGVLLERCVIAFATNEVAAGIDNLLPPAPGGEACRVYLDPAAWFANSWLHTSVSQTTLPLSLATLPASLAGAHFAVQALVFDDSASAWPAYQGVTNAIVITLGN